MARDFLILYLLVACGTALGGTLRAVVSVAVLTVAGPGFPWGTLLVNGIGSFAIGCYATLTESGGRLAAGVRQRQFVMTGVCGGFTTFSLFSLETLRLAQAGAWPSAAGNVAASIPAWLLCVWLGHRLAVRLNARAGARAGNGRFRIP